MYPAVVNGSPGLVPCSSLVPPVRDGDSLCQMTMNWSWLFLIVTLLLVQPGQALHNHEDIRNVVHDRDATNSFWSRALQLKVNPSPAFIIATVLLGLLLVLCAIGACVWYIKWKARQGDAVDHSEANPGRWSRLRSSSPPTDIEKGSKSFDDRFSVSRSTGKEMYDELPSIREPGPPELPYIPKQPTILERIGDPRASSFFSQSLPLTMASRTSRVLLAPPSDDHDHGQKSRWSMHSPTESTFLPRRNPFIRSPSRTGSTVRKDVPAPPMSSPKSSFKPLILTKKQDPARAERVRNLHMDLTEDFTEVEKLTASPQVLHLGEEGLARLRKAKSAKTGKSLRFMLPNSALSNVASLQSATGVSRPTYSPALRTAAL